MQGVSDQLTQVFRKQGVGTYHKPINTIRQQLVHPKDPHPWNKNDEWSIKSSVGIVKRFILGRWQDLLGSDLENMSTVQERQRLQWMTT